MCIESFCLRKYRNLFTTDWVDCAVRTFSKLWGIHFCTFLELPMNTHTVTIMDEKSDIAF